MARNIDVSILRSFMAVAEYGGISKAASTLYLTQSAVSQQIKRLEETVGTLLFLRKGRKLELNEDGERLLGSAETMVRLNDKILKKFSYDEAKEIITIGISEHISEPFLAAILSSCMTQLPDVRIDARVGLNSSLYSDFDEGRVDISLVLREHDSGGDDPVARQRVYWTAAPGFSHQEGTEFPLVLHGGPCMFRAIALSTLDAQKINWKVAYSASTLQDLKAAVRASIGCSALLECEIGEGLELSTGAISKLPPLPPVDVVMNTRRHEKGDMIGHVSDLIKNEIFAI